MLHVTPVDPLASLMLGIARPIGLLHYHTQLEQHKHTLQTAFQIYEL